MDEIHCRICGATVYEISRLVLHHSEFDGCSVSLVKYDCAYAPETQSVVSLIFNVTRY
jgi:hypothetical protein